MSRRLGAGGVSDQLAARRADVAAARLAHRNDDAAIGKDASEAVDAIVRRALEGNPGRLVERQQIDLRLDAVRAACTRRRASSGVSFTPSSSTYSNVMRGAVSAGSVRHASIKSSSVNLRLTGTRRSR